MKKRHSKSLYVYCPPNLLRLRCGDSNICSNTKFSSVQGKHGRPFPSQNLCNTKYNVILKVLLDSSHTPRVNYRCGEPVPVHSSSFPVNVLSLCHFTLLALSSYGSKDLHV